MITLFRRIRQKLIDSGSITKYLLYAIGEILLVVIGILIALQVNNWNEERKEQNKVDQYIGSLSAELEENISFLEMRNQQIMGDSIAIEEFKQRLRSDDATPDTLKKIMRSEIRHRFFLISRLDMSTFNTMEATGDIRLLDPETIQDLQHLSFKIEELFQVQDKLSNNWLDKLYDFYKVIPSPDYSFDVNIYNYMNERQEAEIWDTINPNTLALYSNMIFRKYESSYAGTLSRSRAVEASMKELLDRLKSYSR